MAAWDANRTWLSVILLATFLTISSGETKTVTVQIAGGEERIHAFEQGYITYISFSEFVEVTGGLLDWEIVGHQIRYINGTNRFDFVVNSPFFKLNEDIRNLTFPARLKEGQLYLPAETFLPYLDQTLPQKITLSSGGSAIRVDSEYFNVTDLAVFRKANGLLIEIFLTSSLAYDVFVTEGNWLNVSIREGKINRSRILTRKDARVMYKLKTHQAVGTGQISMRLKRPVEAWHHKLALDPPRIQISIADVSFDLDSLSPAPPIGPDEKIDVIVIDPGHGGKDYGAIGPRGAREKDVVLDVAKELARLIRKDKQFKVVMTRDRDQGVTLQQRAKIANEAGADLFISIHANASHRSSPRGWNVFFLAPARNDSARAVAQFENSFFLRDHNGEEPAPQDEDSDNPLNDEYGVDPVLTILNEMIMTEFQMESHDFAMMVDREFRRQLKIPARGVDQAGFFVLNRVYTPSVLIETGFISNKAEEKVLKSKSHKKAVAKALYNAIKRFRAKYES